MRYALLISILLLAGCQTSRDLNPGAPVLWTVTDYSVLQADAHAAFLVTDPAAATLTLRNVTAQGGAATASFLAELIDLS
jgi:hypothetical protein